MQYMQNPQLVNREHSPDESFPRTPPWSPESEQAVLGCILLNNDCLDRVSEFLRAEHFFDPLHQQIFDAASKLIAARSLASPITMKSYFDGSRPFDPTLTVPQYMGRLGVNACMVVNIRDYAQVIHNMWTRRQLILVGEEMASVAFDSPVDFPPKEQIEEAETLLFALAERGTGSGGSRLFAEAATDAVEDAQKAAREGFSGVRTGFVDIDHKLGGLQPSDLIILAGRPSMGKTALATNIAFNVAMSGTPVDFYSLEMADKQLATRILASKSGVSGSKFRSGRVSEGDLEKLARAAIELRDLPLTIDQTGGITIAQLAARARRVKRKRGTGLIVVDYLQLMQAGKNRRENRVQDVSEITTGLKAIAKELEVPVVALSQLSRNVEHRDNKRPQLSDLRESGSIEQDADIVMFVFREEYYVERAVPSMTDPAAVADWQAQLQACAGKAEVILGKHRHAELCTIPLAFDGQLTRFSSLFREAGHARA
jgi:replicative DNA helicase